jgi:hypothetical protein
MIIKAFGARSQAEATRVVADNERGQYGKRR